MPAYPDLARASRRLAAPRVIGTCPFRNSSFKRTTDHDIAPEISTRRSRGAATGAIAPGLSPAAAFQPGLVVTVQGIVPATTLKLTPILVVDTLTVEADPR